jgi:prepilin-type processing-associated H-X9-DG protein
MRRRALTLVELLAIIAIIGILIALLLPAVQTAREASRQTQCTSNMRQVALAIHEYESAYRVLPTTAYANYSFHVQLLPYIEQTPVYERITFSTNAMDYEGPLNYVRVPVFECPSDDSRLRVPPLKAATNFHGNWGTGAQRYGNNGVFSYRNDLPGYFVYLRFASITDGLSQTAMLAEVAASDGSMHAKRAFWRTPRLTARDQLDEFAAACRAMPTAARKPRPVGRGRPWLACIVISNLYNHVLPPNHPSCANGGDYALGALTSSSFHNFGANVAMADGSIQRVSGSIDITAWRAIGSRAGDP